MEESAYGKKGRLCTLSFWPKLQGLFCKKIPRKRHFFIFDLIRVHFFMQVACTFSVKEKQEHNKNYPLTAIATRGGEAHSPDRHLGTSGTSSMGKAKGPCHKL